MLHKPSKERLTPNVSTMEEYNELLWKHYQNLCLAAEEMGINCMDMLVTFINEDDEFVPGTYVPELHLLVRKIDE